MTVMQETVDDLHEPKIQVRVRRWNGPEHTVEALIDTGSSGSFSLPGTLIRQIGLIPYGQGVVHLADGNVAASPTYLGAVDWFGTWTTVLVFELNSEPLLGRGIMNNCKLKIRFKTSGSVEITPLS